MQLYHCLRKLGGKIMVSHHERFLISSSILIIFLLSFLSILPYIQPTDSEFSTTREDNSIGNSYEDLWHEKQHTTYTNVNGFGSNLGSRSNFDNETESNDNIEDSVNNGNELLSGREMRGEMRNINDELDIFYIDLKGGAQSTIDSVNITPIFTDWDHIYDKAVGIKLKMYTEFEDERYLLEYKELGTDNKTSSWPNATSLFFNADRTGRYYLEVYAQYFRDIQDQVIHPNAMINYSLKVQITDYTSSDKNNDINNGTQLTGPLQGLDLTQAFDHWDWYFIDTLTENRSVNLSMSVEITLADKTNIEHYVKVSCILMSYDLVNQEEISLIFNGDWKAVYNPNPINIHFEATFKKAYLGIHIQQRRFEDLEEVDMVDCGVSNIAYKIKTFKLTLVNTPPQLLQPSLSPTKGTTKDTYTYSAVYQDADNDPPMFVNLTIDDLNLNLTQSTIETNDGNYVNGELYEGSITGLDLSDIFHNNYKPLNYFFSTYDYYPELKLPIKYVETETFSDLSVIDNVLPTLQTNLPTQWTVQEDSEPVYIDLFSIFSDPDNIDYPGEEVKFQVWSGIYGWKNITGTENITLKVLDNDTLELTPETNKFGSDTINIRAFDVEGAEHAVKYTMQIIIEPINDKPILIQLPDYLGTEAIREDEYCNLTLLAYDYADNNEDIMYYSIDIFEKIPLLVDNPKKYKFSFSNLSGKLSFIPCNEMVGIYELNYTATDEGTVEPIGLSDTKQFILQILNTNDPPLAVISEPKKDAKFNTSAIITLSGINSTDDDIQHGDYLYYSWYIYLNGTEKEFLGKFDKPTTTIQIKRPGKHKIELKVKDREGEVGIAEVNFRIISLVGDIPGGDDFDEDGIPDLWEIRYDLNPNKFDSDLDPDNDSFTNLEEYLGEDNLPGGGDSSDPTNSLSVVGDIDADSLPDWWEWEVFNSITQPRDGDPDNDTYTNYEEYLGIDKEPGNGDYSDPLNTLSIPVAKEKDDDKDEGTEFGTMLLIASGIIAIIIFLLILNFHMAKKRKKKAEEEKKKSVESKPIYTPEPQPVPMLPPTQGQVQVPAIPPSSPPMGQLPGTMPVAQPMQTFQPPTLQPTVPMQPGTQPKFQPQVQQPPDQLGLPAVGKVYEIEKPNKKENEDNN